MNYFSGFCLKSESKLFESFTCRGDFCVVGFSYGAQKALEYSLKCKERIDTLQLISPAFFMDKSEKYKRLQMIYFRKNPAVYRRNFLDSVGGRDLSPYIVEGSLEELEELLYYEWDLKKLREIKSRGVEIELFLGSEDRIIDSSYVKQFFQEFAIIHYIKDKGHIL